MTLAWPFTARGAKLEQLGRWYSDQAVGGVVLTGPAGVGKTRLGEEALRSAAGLPTARVAGHPATRDIPLGALVHLLPADIARDLAGGDDDRARLFHRVRLALRDQVGEQRPIVLVDDIDQLDDTSLSILLPFMLDRSIFVIATIRSGQVAPDVVVSLLKDGHLVTEEVTALSPDDVVTLLHRVLDGPIETECVDRLSALSAGNLQVLRELVTRALSQQVLRQVDGSWRLFELPATGVLEDLVGSQLADLSEPDRNVVELLAIAGSLGLADLETIVDATHVEDLERRGIVTVEADERRVRVRLAHPVYGEITRNQLSVLRHRAIFRWLADRLADVGTRRRDDVTRFAQWRLEGGGALEIEVLLQAARLALAGRDVRLARRFANAAIDRGAMHAGVRVLVDAAALTADLPAIEASVARVWNDPSLSDADRLHFTRRLTAATFASGDLAGSLTVLDGAASLVTEPHAQAGIATLRAVILAHNGRPHEALEVLDDVDDAGDTALRVEIETARSVACVSVGRFGEAVSAARAGAEAQARLPAWIARRGMAAHLVNEAHGTAYAGYYASARALVTDALDRARGARALAAEMWFEIVLGEIDRDTGRGRPAIDHFTKAVELASAAGQQGALVWAWVGVAQGNLLVGDCAAAAEAIDHADRAGDSPLATSWSTRERTRAWLHACRGDLALARQTITKAAEVVRGEGISVFEATLLHDLVRLGDPASAVARLVELEQVVEGPLMKAMADRARAAATNDTQLYASVVDQCEAMDSLVLAAEAAVEAAHLHRRRGEQRAAALLTQRAGQFVEMAGGARTPALLGGRGIEPLTAREREVAVLAASGAASKEIGERLAMATRTVDTHLGRVYRKLGVMGRDELATALASHALN